MEKNKILQASLLDIIFDDRNKVYGAYELRNKYSYRLSKALVVTGGLALVVMLASFVSSKFETPKHYVPIAIPETVLTKIDDDPIVEPPPPPPPPPPAPQTQIDMSRFTTPLLTREEVSPDEQMKDIEDLINSKISTVNVKGDKGPEITAPPLEEPNSGIVTAPKKDKEDETLINVQIQAKFPGGEEGWKRYISREIERHMDELQDDGKAGSCMVMFIVDKEGVISDVEALTMKGTKLAEICVNAVRKGPKWIPAENNGQKVKAYRRQPVTFQLLSE